MISITGHSHELMTSHAKTKQKQNKTTTTTKNKKQKQNKKDIKLCPTLRMNMTRHGGGEHCHLKQMQVEGSYFQCKVYSVREKLQKRRVFE